MLLEITLHDHILILVLSNFLEPNRLLHCEWMFVTVLSAPINSEHRDSTVLTSN